MTPPGMKTECCNRFIGQLTDPIEKDYAKRLLEHYKRGEEGDEPWPVIPHGRSGLMKPDALRENIARSVGDRLGHHYGRDVDRWRRENGKR